MINPTLQMRKITLGLKVNLSVSNGAASKTPNMDLLFKAHALKHVIPPPKPSLQKRPQFTGQLLCLGAVNKGVYM